MTSHNHSSWWLNQPLSKICSSNWIISPGIGVKIPKIFFQTTQHLYRLTTNSHNNIISQTCFEDYFPLFGRQSDTSLYKPNLTKKKNDFVPVRLLQGCPPLPIHKQWEFQDCFPLRVHNQPRSDELFSLDQVNRKFSP